MQRPLIPLSSLPQLGYMPARHDISSIVGTAVAVAFAFAFTLALVLALAIRRAREDILALRPLRCLRLRPRVLLVLLVAD